MNDPHSFPSARRAYLRLERRLPELLAFIRSRRSHELRVELELEAPDVRLRGRLDLLLLGPHPCIIDYKTGIVSESEVVREQYRRQLSLYCLLVKHALSVHVDEGALFSLRQGLLMVDVGADAVAEAEAQLTTARCSYNARVPGAQPAVPSDEACGTCRHAGSCDAAWDSLATGAVRHLGWGEAIRGVVHEIRISEARGRAAIVLCVPQAVRTTETDLISVSDVPERLVADMEGGDRVSAWGLVRRSETPLALVWRDSVSALCVR